MIISLSLIIGIFSAVSLADVSLTGGRTHDRSLLLRCHTDGFILWSVYWKRNNTLVGNTNNFGRDFVIKDLLSGTRTRTYWRSHILKIENDLDANVASNWSCSESQDGPFSEPICFASLCTYSESTVAPITETSGNLTIEVHPGEQIEGQLITLTCTTDMPMEYWETLWIRNGHPVFFTSSNSSLSALHNVTVSTKTFFFENITMNANARQQNVTFLVTKDIVDDSSWTCQRDGISGQSNLLNFTEGAVISKVEARKIPSSNEGDNTLPLFIGSVVAGVVVFLAIIAIIALIAKKRHGNHKTTGPIWTSQNSGLHPQRNQSLVTRENSLYESTTDGLLEKKPYEDSEVMVDNILYSSSFKEDEQHSDVYLTAI